MWVQFLGWEGPVEKKMVTHSNMYLPGESQGWGSLVGCHLWGRTGSDTTEATEQQQQQTVAYQAPLSLGFPTQTY